MEAKKCAMEASSKQNFVVRQLPIPHAMKLKAGFVQNLENIYY